MANTTTSANGGNTRAAGTGRQAAPRDKAGKPFKAGDTAIMQVTSAVPVTITAIDGGNVTVRTENRTEFTCPADQLLKGKLPGAA